MSTTLRKTAIATALLSLAFAATAAFADEHRSDGRDGRDGRDRHNATYHDRAPASQARRAPGRPQPYPPVGHEVRTLPRGYADVRVGRHDYRYSRGVFYRPRRDGVYVVIRPPLGARVRYLPPGYITFGIGPSRYFYFDATYYLWDPPRREYVVVKEPPGAPQEIATAASTSGELFVYPNRGQSDEQRERDRYDCYLWASQQTGFDPADEAPEFEKAGDYRRALSACLEGRGYTVK